MLRQEPQAVQKTASKNSLIFLSSFELCYLVFPPTIIKSKISFVLVLTKKNKETLNFKPHKDV